MKTVNHLSIKQSDDSRVLSSYLPKQHRFKKQQILKKVFWPENQEQLSFLISTLQGERKQFYLYNPPVFPHRIGEILIDLRHLNRINHQDRHIIQVEPGISTLSLEQQLIPQNRTFNITHPWLHLRSITIDNQVISFTPNTPLLNRIAPLLSGKPVSQIGFNTYRKNEITRSLFFFKDLATALKKSSEILRERALFIEIINPVASMLLQEKFPEIPAPFRSVINYLSETTFTHILLKKLLKKLPALINHLQKNPLYPVLITYQKDSEIDHLLPSSYDLFSELTPEDIAGGYQFKKLPLLYYSGKELFFSIVFPTLQGIAFLEHIERTFGHRFINLHTVIPVTPLDLICNLTLISPLAPSQQEQIYQRIKLDLETFSGVLLNPRAKIE